MKIIEDSRDKLPTNRVTCDCKSVLEYNELDIEFSYVVSNLPYPYIYFIRCPVCQRCLNLPQKEVFKIKKR